MLQLLVAGTRLLENGTGAEECTGEISNLPAFMWSIRLEYEWYKPIAPNYKTRLPPPLHQNKALETRRTKEVGSSPMK